MRIGHDQHIAGVSATDLRRVFRTMRDHTYRREQDLHAVLGASLELTPEQAAATAAQLIAEGYLERDELGYALAEQGLRLAAASTGKPIPRATAELLLNELIERARAINQSDSWYRVTQIELFGSLLDADRATVNDIDLLVTLTPRYRIADSPEVLHALSLYYQARTGKSGGGLARLLSFPREELFKLLKAGKRAYQLLDATNQEELRSRTTCTVVFAEHAEELPLPAAFL